MGNQRGLRRGSRGGAGESGEGDPGKGMWEENLGEDQEIRRVKGLRKGTREGAGTVAIRTAQHPPSSLFHAPW